ncbi:MAG: cardiolipin synthase [Lachnospiraceae bacterium]|jgi:cardiolipin synthase|nr:cardiolipin synthase [Lachnospiraceae bacterium]
MEVFWTNIREVPLYVFNNLVFINFILAAIIVFFQRKDPKSVWAWLLILYFIPIVGFVFYLLIGTDMYKRRIFRTKEIEDRLNRAIRQQEYNIRNKEMGYSNKVVRNYEDLVLFNLKTSGSILTKQNDVAIFTDGREKFKSLIDDMRGAQSTIHVQYYIIRDDEVFGEINAVLKEKAAEGIEVRVLYDSMGCRAIRESYWRNLRSCGVAIAEFFPALLRRLHLRVNYRNHRKIVVIDGKIGYTGGFNVGREYIGLNRRFGYWRDTHLRIEGEAVQALQVRFMLDWNHATKGRRLSMERYLSDVDYPLKGQCDIQIVTSGPDTGMQNVRDNYLRLITKAKRCIYIQTPYFIPDEAILSALTIAIFSGIEVNIMIPCKPDHPFIYWATYSYVGTLVMIGANCYTYDHGFLHAKVMVVDEEVICCGSANMDIRSFALNFEVNATIYNEEKAREMTAIFNRDIEQSSPISKDRYSGRSLMIRFKEQVSRTLSPLL